MDFVQLVFIIAALGLWIGAVRWIRSRPRDDPVLEQLFFLTSPLLYWLRQLIRRK